MDEDLHRRRHSAAHLMAWAVMNLFEDVKLDIGPATEEGFYYDFDMPHRLTPEDLPKIEKEMKRLAKRKESFEVAEISRDEAEHYLRNAGQDYKVERLEDIPADEDITFYTCGEFSDLCRGPHVQATNQVGAFKLLSIAGSYYRGNENNPMMQRIYGTAFADKQQLQAYLQQLEEAKKRDHRKLGKELDLFSISNEEIGGGLVLWHPKGAFIRNQIESFWRDEHYANGYDLLYTPHVGLSELWQTSGHLEFYQESMYAPLQIDERDFYVKPMNCPFHINVYTNKQRSYRDLPLRWAELGTVYRYEKSGVLHGLLRVRGFTQDDAHIFCTREQIEDEIVEVLRFCLHILASFGFEHFKLYLSTRPEKAVGHDADWDTAQHSLRAAVDRLQLDCDLDEGGGAFYGPKIDIKIKDALGREWQCSTIQFDFNLPERFDISYIGEDGERHRPYMVHRALFGSIPLWLAPVQGRVLPIRDKHHAYAEELRDILREAGLRVEADLNNESLGKKIRNARNQRLQYMLVVGDEEQGARTAAVRHRQDGELGPLPIDQIVTRMQGEVAAHH